MQAQHEFLDALSSAQTNAERHSFLLDQLSSYGLGMAKYGFSIFGGEKPEVSFVGSYHDELEVVVEQHDFEQDDVTVRHCMFHTEPILWASVLEAVQHGVLSKNEERVHKTMADFGLINGLVLPLRDHTVFGRGGIGLCGDGQEDSRKFYDRIGKLMPEIRATCEYFHASIDRQQLHVSPNALSPREIECLRWLAYGLRPQQIGDRLKVSDRTIEHQIASARRKLRAATREQAVAKAIILGVF